MREVFVHEARLELATGADQRAPGAAVTVALCGHWEHEGSCRWPHHTSVETDEVDALTVRTVFVSEAGEEQSIRHAITSAYRGGRLDGPDGVSRWTMLRQGSTPPDDEERAIGVRWIDS